MSVHVGKLLKKIKTIKQKSIRTLEAFYKDVGETFQRGLNAALAEVLGGVYELALTGEVKDNVPTEPDSGDPRLDEVVSGLRDRLIELVKREKELEELCKEKKHV